MLYQPPHFAVGDRDLALELMRRHPLATMLSGAYEDEPHVSHVPLVPRLDGERLVLCGHVARPNPQWKQWHDGDAVLAIFHGPDAYVSPFCYATREAVPTWNYAVVHARGHVTLRHDSDAKEAVLKALIGVHDAPYRERWDELVAAVAAEDATATAPPAVPAEPVKKQARKGSRISSWQQFLVLSKRNITIMTRDRSTLILMLVAPNR